METVREMQEKIIGKADQDADFRALLLSDPKGAVEQALGVRVPESMSVEVHEQSATTVHLILPPDSKLNEDDLQAVAGGSVTMVDDGSGVWKFFFPSTW